jgi:purine-nucleoside phosphorylase
MLRDLTRNDWLSILGITPAMVPQALLLRGTRNLKTQYNHFRQYFSNLYEIGTPNGLVEDVLIGDLGSVRVGYASVYGGAMASEIVHMFGVLGTRLVIQIGCCGALADSIAPGDLVLAENAYCGDGASRCYKPEGNLVQAAPSPGGLKLPERQADVLLHTGSIFTTAALFAEGRREIERWHAQGFAAVDMETAATFAVAEHFGMNRIALLYAFDNPRQSGHLLLDETDKTERRILGNRRMTEMALGLLRDGVIRAS